MYTFLTHFLSSYLLSILPQFMTSGAKKLHFLSMGKDSASMHDIEIPAQNTA